MKVKGGKLISKEEYGVAEVCGIFFNDQRLSLENVTRLVSVKMHNDVNENVIFAQLNVALIRQ